MIGNGIIAIGFGSYLGIILHTYWHPKMMQKGLAHPESWYGKPVLRVLVGLIGCAVCGLPHLISSD